MLSLPPTVQIFIASGPVDLRKGFEGLAGLVRGTMGRDPLSGHLFCFFNRRRDRAKILFFDRTGYCIFYKRLERGRFHLPSDPSVTSIEVEGPDLLLLLEGIDLRGAKRRLRWRRSGGEKDPASFAPA